MDYTLVRSERRTLSVGLDAAGALTVRAPAAMPIREIERFLSEKRGWIESKREQLLSSRAQSPALRGADGETLPLFGREITLRLTRSGAPRLSGDALILPEAGALSALDGFLYALARRELPPRARLVVSRLSIYPASISVTGARTRWGSMSSRGAMNLSRYLILCPEDVIEYVVAHELCHIAHPDHSAAFWRSVERAAPDYREKREWLKRNARLMRLVPKGGEGGL